MNRISILLWSLLLLMAGCRDNFDITTTRQLGPLPEVNVEASLIGRVVDPNGNPLSDVQVVVAGQSIDTDERGMFQVDKKLMNKNGTYIRAFRYDMFDAFRFAFPRLNKITYIEISMTPKSSAVSFQSADGAQFSGVRIPANALADENGQAYTGNVEAYVTYLDPSDTRTFDRMPGDLRALDANSYAKVLTSFGMVGVELIGESGQKLNILAGQKATIFMPLSAELQGQAPSTIPTWHFDEASGYWKEEGQATLVGNHYEMEVPHFSFWNCDVASDCVVLSGHITNPQGTPLTNYKVALYHESFGTGTAFTDADGYFGGLVPANVPFDLNVLNTCNEVLAQQNVGPFTADVDLGAITVNDVQTVTVSGSLLDCNASPLANGWVQFKQNDVVLSTIFADANGNFSVTLSNCNDYTNLIVTAFDMVNVKQSEPTTVTFTGNTGNAGTITVCSLPDQYLIFSFDGHTQIVFGNYLDFQYGVSNNGYLGAGIDTVYISLSFENLVGQQAEITEITGTIRDNNQQLHNYGCSYCGTCPCSDLSAGPLQFTEVPTNPGEYGAGSASGMIREQGMSTPVPYTVQFRLKLE